MLKKLSILLALCLLLSACGSAPAPAATETTAAQTVEETVEETTETTPEETEAAVPALPDGVYTAVFDTDSSMFHVSEACEGRGTLTVSGGVMTLHVSLTSKNILNLFPGLKEDAEKEGAELLQPTVDTVTYSDGLSEEVHGFDIPVPYLDEEFDLALIGKKGTWYDHKVSVSDPQRIAPEIVEGTTVAVTLAGGSGRASVESPAVLVTDAYGVNWAVIVWSSPNYTYMLVDGVHYDPIQEEGNSTFLIPVVLDCEMAVSAETVAMSSPHLVEYTLHFDSTTISAE